jgi:hypothetical protein
MDPLHLAQELVFFEYFPENKPPTLTDVGMAQDILREVERQGS